MNKVDILVVGAGPCGLSVGVAAAREGLSCVTIEKGCVTRAISLYPTYGNFFSTPDKLELGDVPFITSGDKPTRREALRYYRAVVDRFDLDVRQYEEVVGVEGEPGEFVVRSRSAAGEREYRARRVVIATGYFDTPNLLDVPGEELEKVTHWYTEGAPFFQQKCMVVGGGNSAAEAALDLYRSGAEVMLVHFEPEMDPGIKPWIMPDLTNRCEEGDIDAHWCCRVTRIEPDSVSLRDENTGEEYVVPNDFVFAMTGWTPEAPLLRQLGVHIDRDSHIPAHDPETFETDQPGIHVAGVLVSGSNQTFIENGREHGARIVRAVGGALHQEGRADRTRLQRDGERSARRAS